MEDIMHAIPTDEAFAFLNLVLGYPLPEIQRRAWPADQRDSLSPIEMKQGLYTFRVIGSEIGIAVGLYRGDRQLDRVDFKSNFTGYNRRLFGAPLFELPEQYEARQRRFLDEHHEGYYAFWQVDQLGLPYWDGDEWSAPVPENRTWLSADRAAVFGDPPFSDERPVGFRYTTAGPPGYPYAPLYDRTVPMERITEEKFYSWERSASTK